jgi:large subunit ribosomal protein L25
MAESKVINTEKREGRGSKLAHVLRKQNKVPCVVYGHKEANLSLSVEHKPLVEAIRHGARVVDLQIEKGIEKAQIVEVQWDHLGKDILHVDFKRVSADERIEVEVPLEIKGIAPGVAAGGALDQPLHTLRISCLALSVPDSIRVVINELQVGQAIHIKDLKLPENVLALEDGDAIIIHVIQPQVEVETTGEPTESAEPEVITRKKTDEEEEEEKK